MGNEQKLAERMYRRNRTLNWDTSAQKYLIYYHTFIIWYANKTSHKTFLSSSIYTGTTNCLRKGANSVFFTFPSTQQTPETCPLRLCSPVYRYLPARYSIVFSNLMRHFVGIPILCRYISYFCADVYRLNGFNGCAGTSLLRASVNYPVLKAKTTRCN